MAKGSARARVAAVVRRLAPGGSADAQAEAAHALARLCSDKSRNKEYVRGCGGVAALVGLLAPGGPPAVQQRAAAALESLCVEDRASQDSMRECGGVPALVGLLAPGGPPAVQAQAAAVLQILCKGDPQVFQACIGDCGGVPALVGLLAPGSPPGVQVQAAAALARLCLTNARNQDSMRECGGIAALVALLAPGGSAAVQTQAAGALGNLCVGSVETANADSQDSVRGKRLLRAQNKAPALHGDAHRVGEQRSPCIFIKRCGAGCSWQAVAQVLFITVKHTVYKLHTAAGTAFTRHEQAGMHAAVCCMHAATEPVQVRSVAEC